MQVHQQTTSATVCQHLHSPGQLHATLTYIVELFSGARNADSLKDGRRAPLPCFMPAPSTLGALFAPTFQHLVALFLARLAAVDVVAAALKRHKDQHKKCATSVCRALKAPILWKPIRQPCKRCPHHLLRIWLIVLRHVMNSFLQ